MIEQIEYLLDIKKYSKSEENDKELSEKHVWKYNKAKRERD